MLEFKINELYVCELHEFICCNYVGNGYFRDTTHIKKYEICIKNKDCYISTTSAKTYKTNAQKTGEIYVFKMLPLVELVKDEFYDQLLFTSLTVKQISMLQHKLNNELKCTNKLKGETYGL